MTKKTALIFGASGQDGTLMSQLLLEKKYNVLAISRGDSKKKFRDKNLLNRIKSQ